MQFQVPRPRLSEVTLAGSLISKNIAWTRRRVFETIRLRAKSVGRLPSRSLAKAGLQQSTLLSSRKITGRTKGSFEQRNAYENVTLLVSRGGCDSPARVCSAGGGGLHLRKCRYLTVTNTSNSSRDPWVRQSRLPTIRPEPIPSSLICLARGRISLIWPFPLRL